MSRQHNNFYSLRDVEVSYRVLLSSLLVVWLISIYTMIIFICHQNYHLPYISYFTGLILQMIILQLFLEPPRTFRNSLNMPNPGQRVCFISIGIFHLCWSVFSLSSEMYDNNKFLYWFWICVGLNSIYFMASGIIKYRHPWKFLEADE